MKTIYTTGATMVGNAGEKGLGVFATRDIKKGEVYETCPTIEIPAGEATVLRFTELSFYCFDHEEADATVIGLGNASLYNNSKNPTAEWVVGNRVIAFKALQDIKAEEEILIDYEWADEFVVDFIEPKTEVEKIDCSVKP